MVILKDISILWALIHTLLMFLFLSESRYSKRKTVVITALTMAPLILGNLALVIIFGTEIYGKIILLTLSIPSLIICFIFSKYRNGRFFFTFCMVDTVSMEIITITQIINHYTTPDTYIVMFATRLLIYPLLELFIFKFLRSTYIDVQKQIEKGWGLFAVIGALFYVAIALLTYYPTSVINNPQYMPALSLLFLLMPVIYFHIIRTLRHQQKLHEISEQENILKLQAENMAVRMEELSSADEKFRIERHNFRHKMRTIASLAEKEEYEKLKAVVQEYNDSIRETQVKRYCTNVIIDAVLSSYISKAQQQNITVNTSISLPNELGVNDSELATVIANAIENASNACMKIPEGKRFIKIKAIYSPCFVIQISNSFNGQVTFGPGGVPINSEEGHGFGTRSIVSFCEKNGVFYEFKAEEDVFTVKLVFG